MEYVTLVTHVTQGYKIAVCEKSSSFLPYMAHIGESETFLIKRSRFKELQRVRSRVSKICTFRLPVLKLKLLRYRNIELMHSSKDTLSIECP